MKKTFTLCLSFVLLFYLGGIVWALATEDIGNEPLHEVDYQDWPGIMPVINHASRAYHIWVNGHETFYYQGNIKALNDHLKKFSRAKSKRLEVLIRPGPSAPIKTFKGIDISYSWELELMGGISKHLTTDDLGDRIWSPYPMLTIYISKEQTLSSLETPPGVTILELSDLKNRYVQGLSSKDDHVRGWGAERLARLDPYDSNSISNIALLLEDEEWWVRLCAIGALQTFGQKAQSVIPQIQACADTDQERLRDRVTEVVNSVQSAKTEKMKESSHNKMLNIIHKYVEKFRRKL